MSFVRGLGILGVVVGLLIIVTVGVVAWVVVPNIIDTKIKEETRLISESETWEKWVDITIPIQLSFYIFNVTNPRGIENREKLNFEEHGPYVYDEVRRKGPPVSIGQDGEVTYKQTIEYYFNAEASVGSEDDLFNVVNVPLISVATVGYGTMEPGNATDPNITGLELLQLLLFALTNEDQPRNEPERLIKTGVSVKEIIFDGWTLHPWYNLLPSDMKPPEFEGGTFGLYKGKNGSNDGEYVVKSGAGKPEEFGQIVSWKSPPPPELNATNILDWWYPQTDLLKENQTFCNMINGSDGSLFPPFNTKDSVLRIFQTDVCRSLHLTYEEEMEFRDIPGYRFGLPDNLFEDPALNGDNLCFCPHPSPNYPDRLAHQCIRGVIRIFPCKNGAPIVTSNPHFLEAADIIFEPIVIATPDPAKHTTFIEIEPDSGMLLRASKKVQISVELQPVVLPQVEDTYPTIFSNGTLNFMDLYGVDTPSILLPIVWADERVELDEQTAKDLYDKLLKPQKIINIVKWVMIGLGGVIFLLGCFGVYKG